MADARERLWTVQTGAGEGRRRCLVELLVEAFAALGVASSRELAEQLRKDSGRNGDVRVDLLLEDLMSRVRAGLEEAGVSAEEAEPAQAAAQGLLLRALQHFVPLVSQQPDSAGLRCGSAAAIRRACPQSGATASIGTARCCTSASRRSSLLSCQGGAQDPDSGRWASDEETDDEELALEHAMQILLAKTAELAHLQEQAQQASPSPRHREALRYATQRVARCKLDSLDLALSTPSSSRDQVLTKL